MPRYKYVVADNLHTARSIASTSGWDTYQEAAQHRDAIKLPAHEELYHPPFRVYKIRMRYMRMIASSPDGRKYFEE